MPRPRAFATLAASLLLAVGRVWGCGPHPVGVSPYGRLVHADAQGAPAGLDVEFLAALAARSGCAVPVLWMSRAGVVRGMAEGNVALSPSTIATPERAALGALWPYTRSPMVVLVPEALAPGLPDRAAFDARADLKVVIVRGNRHGDDLDAWLQRLQAQARVTVVSDVPAAVRVLRAGRAHAVVSAAVAMDASMDGLRAMDWDGGRGVVGHLWVSHRVPAADQQRLHDALKAMVTDGTLDHLLQRHLGERWARRARLAPAN